MASVTCKWTSLVSLTHNFFNLSQANIGRGGAFARVHRQGRGRIGVGAAAASTEKHRGHAYGTGKGAHQGRVHGRPWRSESRREKLLPRLGKAGGEPRLALMAAAEAFSATSAAFLAPAPTT